MKFRYIIVVALIAALVVLRFSPGLAPHAMESRPEPAATKARQRPPFLAPQHAFPRPNPSLNRNVSLGVGLRSTALTDQGPAPQPAVGVDLGSASTLTPEQDQEVQQMAEELTERLSCSGLDPASPEYRRLWNDTVRQSDFIFMQRYGAEAWEAHHIQAYHLAHDQH